MPMSSLVHEYKYVIHQGDGTIRWEELEGNRSVLRALSTPAPHVRALARGALLVAVPPLRPQSVIARTRRSADGCKCTYQGCA